jgi:formamidopyrimidine-DNA glycosylase
VPEALEAEIWKVAISDLVGRRISSAWVDQRVAPSDFERRTVGCSITGVRRVGKVVLVDTDGPTIGLHFGMTGRVVVDGRSPIERLEYSSGRDDPSWDRLVVSTQPSHGDDPALRFNDPRRFGHVSLDPDVSHLGVDVFDVSIDALRSSFARRRAPVKAVLLDQRVVAGLGNLCVDEVMWWAGVDPRRSADRIDGEQIARIVGAVRRRLPIMLRRGGSTTGRLSPQVRAALPPCPRDGAPLCRAPVGGRTTVWCARHQH